MNQPFNAVKKSFNAVINLGTLLRKLTQILSLTQQNLIGIIVRLGAPQEFLFFPHSDVSVDTVQNLLHQVQLPMMRA